MEIQDLNSIIGTDKRPKHFEEWNEVRREMYVHTRGALPAGLLKTRRPNEAVEVYNYRLEAYEPITKGAMNKAIDKLFRMFQSANFSIQVSDSLKEYLKDKKFNGEAFLTFIQKYVLRRMIEDPNGLLVWIPSGPGLDDPSIKIDVEGLIVSSEDIRFKSKDAVSWISREEFSTITSGGKKQEEGEIYYTLTKESFFKHVQVGAKEKKSFQVFEVYRHNAGEVPAIVLGGNPTDDDYFESYFSPFLPFANEAIRQYSDWQGVMTMSAFPYREEVAEDCPEKGCRNGIVWDKEKEEGIICDTCKGEGKVFARGPYGVFVRSKGSSVFDGDKSDNQPLVRFVSPPVDIIKYSGEAWKNLLDEAQDALHLIFTKEAQSGKAKEIDREDSDAMITKISNNVFDEIIFKSLLFIEIYREIESPVQPLIVKPISFRVKTEQDLIEEINQLSDKNAPVAFQVEAAKDLARKRFSGNQSVARMVEVLVAFDPIYNVSTADKSILLANGTIKKQDIQKSLFAYKTLQELVSTEGTEFLEKPLKEIFEKMNEGMNYLFDEAPTISIDEERRSEAQARIRGSVGGVQGIIEINKAVAAGEMSESAGETILISIYGVDEATAREMVQSGTIPPELQLNVV